MTRSDRVVFHVLGFAVAASGLVYLWMKYAMSTDDPFALVNHPWEPAMLSLHVLSSPALLVAFGILFNGHVLKQIRAWRRESRRSGLVSLGLFAIVALSGYLLQVTTVDAVRVALVVSHAGGGMLFAVAYGAHLAAWMRRPSARAPRREAA